MAADGVTIVLDLDLLVPALISLIAGLVIHSFIIGVNVSDWWRGRSVTPVDHIVTSLGAWRLCIQCAITLYLSVLTFCLRSPGLHVYRVVISLAYAFFFYANIGSTSLLSIVLCLKISNLHTRLFLYLRRMILHRTGYLIVGSGIFSTLICLMMFVSFTKFTTSNVTYNAIMYNNFPDCLYVNNFYTFTTGSLFPLLFYCISSVLLFVSLYHHTTRMKKSSNLSINLETYYSVMKLVSFTFLYITIYFAGHFACIFYYSSYCVVLVWLYVILDFLQVLHSSYLIYRMTKLRNQMSKVLQNVMDLLFKRKNSDTIENTVKVVGQ